MAYNRKQYLEDLRNSVIEALQKKGIDYRNSEIGMFSKSDFRLLTHYFVYGDFSNMKVVILDVLGDRISQRIFDKLVDPEGSLSKECDLSIMEAIETCRNLCNGLFEKFEREVDEKLIEYFEDLSDKYGEKIELDL